MIENYLNKKFKGKTRLESDVKIIASGIKKWKYIKREEFEHL